MKGLVQIMEIGNRLTALRREMDCHGIDIYVVPSCDFHGSEYLGEHFKTREYISGFTGSAGTVVVTKDSARLWTDGRYFVQAQKQLPKEYTLMKEGEKNTPTIKEYISSYMKNAKRNITIGFDGRCMCGQMQENICPPTGAKVKCDIDLVGNIWENRPVMCFNKVWKLEECYGGKPTAQKIKDIREEMASKSCDVLVETVLENIAWTLNLRGNDIECTPVFLSFLLIEQEEITLFVEKRAIDNTIEQYLTENKIKIRPYEEIYQAVSKIKDKKVWVDVSSANYKIINLLKDENEIYNDFSAALKMKAVKNDTEIRNMKKAHLMDGVAMTKFIYWLKTNVGNIPMDEIVLGEKLEFFRSMAESYRGPSFAPIVGYKDHGAIVHYSATKESNYQIEADNIVLIDSGGHYLEGTTDITRTISLGTVTDKMKKMYTAVLKGHLNLAAAVFKAGCTGVSLDYLARKPLWDMGMDYNHGTGHGVGYLLSVHEPPNAIRYRILENPALNVPLVPGMITSNEPGVYLENEFGIRIENLILCKEKEKNCYGEFLEFETLTLVPYDKDLIDNELLSDEERKMLVQYNQRLYKALGDYLSEDEKRWLRSQ